MYSHKKKRISRPTKKKIGNADFSLNIEHPTSRTTLFKNKDIKISLTGSLSKEVENFNFSHKTFVNCNIEGALELFSNFHEVELTIKLSLLIATSKTSTFLAPLIKK